MKTFAINKRATFDYQLLEEFEAGLVLFGHEVKSVKNGHMSLKGAFVTSKGEELYLTNSTISLYKCAGKIADYDPIRARKLLLRKKQIKYLIGKKQADGLTLVPISVYNKEGLIKLNFSLAKGKKKIDKRETIKKRESTRNIERIMKSRR